MDTAGCIGKVTGVGTENWLLRFNKDGTCDSPQTRASLLTRLGELPEMPIVLCSHGWNNEYGEAADLYRQLLMRLEALRCAHATLAPEFVFVGVVWPSTWFSFDKGPAIASAGISSAEERFAQELAAGLPTASRESFIQLASSPWLTEGQAQHLSSLMADAMAVGAPTPSEGMESGKPLPADLKVAMGAVQEQFSVQMASSSDDLPDGGVVGSAATTGLKNASTLCWLDPRNALRIASVYQMKDRAGLVGFKGVGALLSDILSASRARVHLVGHSYGSKVVLSALASLIGARAVTSVLLLEPAVSHLCFAETLPGSTSSGGYFNVLEKVSGSIALTYSRWDFPLHDVFHLALRRAEDLGELAIGVAGEPTAGDPPSRYAALGGYGPRAANQTLMSELPAPGTLLPQLRAAGLFGFDGTLDKRVSSHGDVTTPYTAWLLHQQMEP